MPSRPSRPSRLLPLLCLLAAFPVAAADIEPGRRLFAANCAVCHGTPPDRLTLPAVMAGAGDGARLRRALQSQVQMGFLADLLDQDDLDRIADYLAAAGRSDAERVFDWIDAGLANMAPDAERGRDLYGQPYRRHRPAGFELALQGERILLRSDHPALGLRDLGSLPALLDAARRAGF